jgi:hypothetical protein
LLLILCPQVPRDEGFLAVLHITPVRASRSLALRHVAKLYGLDMAHVSIAVFVPEVTGSAPDLAIGSFTSDTADLLAGWQKVGSGAQGDGAASAWQRTASDRAAGAEPLALNFRRRWC